MDNATDALSPGTNQWPEHLPSGVTNQRKRSTYARPLDLPAAEAVPGIEHLARTRSRVAGGAQSRGNSVLLIGGAANSGQTGTGSES
jgi:hypothetical protein